MPNKNTPNPVASFRANLGANSRADDQQPRLEHFSLPDLCTVQALLFSIVAGVLLSIVFALLQSDLQHFNWSRFALIGFLVLWITLLSAGLLCRLRPLLAKLSLLRGLVCSYSIVLLITGSISLLAQWVNVNFLGAIEPIDYLLSLKHLLIAAILGGVALRYLYLQQQLHMQQQVELASRIQALQSRIRPHFLFNSMNIIASLIATNPELAEEVVEDLADLFRATLSEANNLSSINTELELAEKYVHIESLRLGERLQVDWQLDDFDDNILIPHLSLQPLLENAIYHGIQPLTQGGTVIVSIHQQGSLVTAEIRNPCPTLDSARNQNRNPGPNQNQNQNTSSQSNSAQHPGRKQGNQLALDNLKRRLEAYYGDKASFHAAQDGAEFRVSFSFPAARAT